MKCELLSGILKCPHTGTTALTGSAPANAVVHEKLDVVNSGYLKRNAFAGNTPISVRIALKQSNIDKGDDYLMEV